MPVNREDLLNTTQMAQFVKDGFLRFDEIVPKDLCEEAQQAMVERTFHHGTPLGCDFNDAWPAPNPIGKVMRLPKVQGMIESLVGPNPRFDHQAAHLTPAKTKKGANLHQDASIDFRFEQFDIQISFFPADTPVEMGGTLFVPGSHFRRVHTGRIGRYQHVRGQVQCVCKAGTIVVWHHNLWHAARCNDSDLDRYMFKVRLNPKVKQQRLWNTDDWDDEAVNALLKTNQDWYGDEGRVESMQRAKLWASLSGEEYLRETVALGFGRNSFKQALI